MSNTDHIYYPTLIPVHPSYKATSNTLKFKLLIVIGIDSWFFYGFDFSGESLIVVVSVRWRIDNKCKLPIFVEIEPRKINSPFIAVW